MRPDAEETLRLVLARLDDMKAEDTVTIDLTGKSTIADTMVVTSGRSNRHVGAVAERVLEDLAKAGVPGVRVEGMPHCDWVLIDAGDVIVHVFRPEVRAFYNLEKMWAPARRADGAQAEAAADVARAGSSAGLSAAHGPCVSWRMRIVVAAVGRLKQGPERELAERYRKRAADAGRSAGLRAFESSKSGKAAPASRPAHDRRIDRDRQHRPRTRRHGDPGRARREHEQQRLRRLLQGWRDADRPAVVFIIGGPDGLAPSLREKAASPRLRRGDLAAPAGAHHAAGAALPGRHDPRRAPISSRSDGGSDHRPRTRRGRIAENRDGGAAQP